jgi:hypothetical protein
VADGFYLLGNTANKEGYYLCELGVLAIQI